MDDYTEALRLQLAELHNTDVHNLTGLLDVLTPSRTSALNATFREIFGLGGSENDESGDQNDRRRRIEEPRNVEAAFLLQEEMESSRRRQNPFMGLIQAIFLPSMTSSLAPVSNEERLVARIRRQEEADRRRQEEAGRRRLEEVERRRQEEVECRRQEEAERRRNADTERRRQEDSESRRQQEIERRRQLAADRRRQRETEHRRQEEAPSPFLRMLELFLNSLTTPSNPSLSASQLNDIPTARHDFDVSGGSATSPAQCSICLVDYVRGDEKRILPCAHSFHKHCADQWLVINATCPVCRSRVY